MTHIWLRAESRANEKRSPLSPEGARALIAAGVTLTVEDNPDRCIPTADYAAAGAAIAARGSWPDAPADAIILGLKELPDDGSALKHRHIMFGHAFKGQPDGPALLARFRDGGGSLLDLEYLVNDSGRRLAAFGYWAGFAGAAVTLRAYAAQAQGGICPPVDVYASADAMVAQVAGELAGLEPHVIVIGALGRVGSGARDMCGRVGLTTTDWDMAETAGGGPFPQVLEHEVFLNCILANPGCPVFVPRDAALRPRHLRTIGDIACDPGSDYNPVPVYDRATDWAAPVVRVADDPVLDVMAIDNLPSLLPAESSADFAGQLLPLLMQLVGDDAGVWARATRTFETHLTRLERKAS